MESGNKSLNCLRLVSLEWCHISIWRNTLATENPLRYLCQFLLSVPSIRPLEEVKVHLHSSTHRSSDDVTWKRISVLPQNERPVITQCFLSMTFGIQWNFKNKKLIRGNSALRKIPNHKHLYHRYTYNYIIHTYIHTYYIYYFIIVISVYKLLCHKYIRKCIILGFKHKK